MPFSESDYDLAFATGIRDCQDFRHWVLSRTKFGDCKARVLADEQAAARKAKHWWKHWWCRVPELGKDSETDVFLVFEHPHTFARFALHVENKTAEGSFTENQAESYACRAAYMMTKHRDLFGYTAFDTLIIAPRAFKQRHEWECNLFGSYLSYEEIGEFLPAFTQ